MATQSTDQTVFTSTLLALFDEAFETHHGIFLNKGTSLFETLDPVTASQASRPISSKSASIAAHVSHVTFYLDVLEQYMLGQNPGDVDWDEIWRTVKAVSPDQWTDIKQALRQAHKRVRASMQNIESWDREGAMGGALAMVVHTAYHLGAIRQALCALR